MGTVPSVVKREMNSTMTITFCDQAENHVGMQKIGRMADNGFTREELVAIACRMDKCELFDLGENASILVIRRGACILLNDENASARLYAEHEQLRPLWDTKAKMRGKVVNKKARYNLCFADFDRAPNYDVGHGTVVNFTHTPYTDTLRKRLPLFLGDKAENMYAEANYYYDLSKCYIGFHGDSERRRVIGLRLGCTMPLYFQWYKGSDRVGDPMMINLNHGDIYIMSEKAVGTDWKRKNISTLRHAAGMREVLEKHI